MSEQTRRWRLGKDFEAQISIDPARLTPRSLARMRRYIDALEMEASISWPTDDAPADPTTKPEAEAPPSAPMSDVDHDAHGGKYLEPFDRGRR